ncbi:micrococcal nuclease [Gracilibacillus ureilyticus]|uniref:Micrococcal nuclease n=1 Tax=Gracilibacillus ureilyticus TaxID=531814 RepID=A0A1H9P610_9BACI|nr:thermonuclease family protein [Gracilibacillus ureilyticus]SER43527.1 micrococcal nuclease [Gracilibacillus ureilyticus]
MDWKKWLYSTLFIIIVLSGCGTASSVQDNNTGNDAAANKDTSSIEQPTNEFITAEVIRVVDGDTVNVKYSGKEESIRLLLVDTPETKHPDLPVQPFGPEATKFAEETLAGEEIQLEFDGPERDKYDRVLVYIWINGENFNQLLIENGLARYAYVYDPPYTHQAEMKAAEDQARSDSRGIWSIPGYVTEDGFDHKQESKNNHTVPSDEVYFQNCTEAHEAGVTPLHEGDPGYRQQMDGDKDGIACE